MAVPQAQSQVQAQAQAQSQPQAERIQDLEESFRVFNRVSEHLEASYHQLENSVSQLHGELTNPEYTTPPESSEVTAETQLRAILKKLPAGVVVLDGSGRVCECNPFAKQLLGEPLQDEIWASVIARAFSPRSDDGHEISLQNGRRVSISTCPLEDVPGQVLLINDVTETRELQRYLGQHQRLIAMGEMAAGLAHQIRTPLASSLLFASQLKHRKLDDDSRVEIADKVMTQLRQLETLISDMLMFSRSGYSGDESITVDVLLADLATAVSNMCEQRDITLLISSDTPTHRIKGNPRILGSALLNLANNAIQAIGKNGTLHLHAHDGLENTVEVCVIDDGPGIPESIKKDLFKPFFTTRSDGTGLGLAVVQAVARAHGGSVRLESVEGQGSRFIVQLPIANLHTQD
ncbi:PAS domain-containing protein [Gammaproteobacteria bacterium AH-315-K14]|nr:PAS domain-containing protein [Gammaproteobacteria bacterium AH-315-K14]